MVRSTETAHPFVSLLTRLPPLSLSLLGLTMPMVFLSNPDLHFSGGFPGLMSRFSGSFAIFHFLHGGVFLLLLLLQRCELLEKYAEEVDLGLPLYRLPLKRLQIPQDLPCLRGGVQTRVFRLVLQDELQQLHEFQLHGGLVVHHIVLPLLLSDELDQNKVDLLHALGLCLCLLFELSGVCLDLPKGAGWREWMLSDN